MRTESMRTDHNARIPKKSLSWPRRTTAAVKKWLNVKNTDQQLHPDFIDESFGMVGQQRRKSCSDRDGCSSHLNRKSHVSGGWLVEENLGRPPPGYGSTSSWHPPNKLRVLVGTWNVGGRAPHQGLDISDWLLDHGQASSSSPPHIYVLGFQEIVPLNAGNVLGAEDKEPASKWLDLIGRALNPSSPSERTQSLSDNYRPSATEAKNPGSGFQKAKASFSDLLVTDDTVSEEPEEDEEEDDSEPSTSNPDSSSEEEEETARGFTHGRRRASGCYRLAASKQMVGIFLCVWVRADVVPLVASVRVSCVGTGIMGYMGNKGSISISLTLLGERSTATSLCFVCTHLASGEKDGDEVRRNCDVAEILRRTSFPRPPAHRVSWPETILEHDKVVWLGDLNYRLSTSGGDMKGLLERNEWRALLEKDQLRAEQRAGRVLGGWEEGEIRFPPTYKYLADSDTYAMMSSSSSSGKKNASSRDKKKRTPAWCDRILWRGEGMEQAWYERRESRFSDHRPVTSLFSIILLHGNGNGDGDTHKAAAPRCCCRSRACGGGAAAVEAEEMLAVLTSCHHNSSSRF